MEVREKGPRARPLVIVIVILHGLRLVTDKGQDLIYVEIDHEALLVLLLVRDLVRLAPAELFDLHGV